MLSCPLSTPFSLVHTLAGPQPQALQAEDELPERLIGSVRFEHLDLKTAAYLDDESGRIFKNEKFGG